MEKLSFLKYSDTVSSDGTLSNEEAYEKACQDALDEIQMVYDYCKDTNITIFELIQEHAKQKDVNCLAYALRFWKKYPQYRLFYKPGHVINADGIKVFVEGADIQFLPAEDYGYEYFVGAFAGLLDDYEHDLLKEYFSINNNSTK